MLKNKIFANASWMIVCRIIQALLNFVVVILTARYLGPSDFGVVSYAMSIVAFVLPITQLGLNNILVQETVMHPEEEGKIFGTSMCMSVCSAIACMGGLFGFVNLVNAGERITIIVCALYSIILIFQALELIQYWFQAKYLSKYFSIIALVAFAIVTAYKIFLLVTDKSVYWFAVSNALDYMLIAVGLLIFYHKLGGARLRFSWQVMKRMFGKSKHYIVSSLMVTIFAQTDKIMIKLMMGDAETGYYTAAVNCASMTSFVFVAIIDAFRPSIFEDKAKGDNLYETSLTRLYSIIIYLSLAQCVFMTLLAKPIIDILYGAEFAPAIPALMLIVWYTTFSYLGSVRNIWILAESKQKFLWIINLSGAILNIILNAVFIPLWGIVGASFASLVTQVFTNVIMNIIVYPIKRNNYLMLKALNPNVIVKMLKRSK